MQPGSPGSAGRPCPDGTPRRTALPGRRCRSRPARRAGTSHRFRSRSISEAACESSYAELPAGARASVQFVVAVLATSDRLATGSSPVWNCAWSRITWRSRRSRQSIGLDKPMPRRSTATTGRDCSTSAPDRDSQTGNCVDDGRSEPVVNTSGPASCGVWFERARTTPMLTVPVPPLGSRSAS